jgi:hypothetical protein
MLPWRHRGWSRVIVILFFFNLGARWGCVVTLTPHSLHICVKTLATHCIGGAKGLSGRVRKISPPQGFDPRIPQPVASCYTYWAIPAHSSVKWTSLITFVNEICMSNKRYCHHNLSNCSRPTLSAIVDCLQYLNTVCCTCWSAVREYNWTGLSAVSEHCENWLSVYSKWILSPTVVYSKWTLSKMAVCLQ